MENIKSQAINPLNDYFDKIIYINRNSRADRRLNILKRLKEKGIIAERFRAIEGGHIDKSKLSFEGQIKRLDNGEIGCYLSHRAIWEMIKENGWKRTLILEDDAIFTDHFKPELLKDIPELWDMLYLGQWNYDDVINGGNEKGGKTFALKEQINPFLWKANRCWLTHAYAVDIEAIDYLLDNTKNLYSSLDNVISDIQGDLIVLAVHPNWINQDGSKGDLRINRF